jgi:hypothetical protein
MGWKRRKVPYDWAPCQASAPATELVGHGTAHTTKKVPSTNQRKPTGVDVVTVANLEKGMVAKDGLEPPTQGFSVLCSTN